ncbi:hypothetical protein ACFZBZ_33110 [Streptomyces sp. NPDC008196]|uniref:hypothetical protein n=1 Tax=Streptomyces sp. NPDC008196 TaxID=3364819 RepID=UPI0036E6FDF3
MEPEPAEGGQPVLRTDGLIEDRHQDVDAGPEGLRTVPARADRAPEETCEAVRDTPLPARPSDDVACLDELSFTIEPVAGEPVTNAIRHAVGPSGYGRPATAPLTETSSGPNCRCRKGATGHEHMSLRSMFGKGLVNENDYR